LCWQGELLGYFYKPLGEMATSVYVKLTQTNDILKLMMLAFSLWMAFQILRHVSTTSPESIGEFWTKVLRKATLCFACGYLASSPDGIFYVLNTFVFPIYLTLLELCGNVIDITSNTPEAAAKSLKLPGSSEICETYNYSMSGGCKLPDTSSIGLSVNEFPKEPLNMMTCMACAVGSRLDVGYHVAVYAMKSGFFGFLVGCFLIAAFFITKIGFAMYLVDSIFRLDMIIIIAPFLILFYPFEQTRKWTATGFKIILNSSAIMLCLGVLMSMTVLAMQKILVNPSMGEFGSASVYSEFGVVPISLIFLGFVIIKASGIAVSLSESITGGGGDTKFQKKMAALVGTVAKGLFVGLTAGVGKSVTALVDRVERLKAMRDKIQKTSKKIEKVRNTMSRLAGRK
ncbi:MAG: hypothetical protein IJ677_03330, partial [Alphaproteobacteria bacterium]|nr:hypothetical protein [Alphaproteobacteria bacterium]